MGCSVILPNDQLGDLTKTTIIKFKDLRIYIKWCKIVNFNHLHINKKANYTGVINKPN